MDPDDEAATDLPPLLEQVKLPRMRCPLELPQPPALCHQNLRIRAEGEMPDEGDLVGEGGGEGRIRSPW